jgi:3-deoxy-manno-octulosonate cytidylyltransferase (CMP-KDO synthetase)
MKILGIIPARYASTRFPAKPLADMAGQSMIERVYRQAKKSSTLSDVLVATDDQRIFDHVDKFGGRVCMTSPHHQSGTDRCFEALQKQQTSCQYVVNIQGDEPFIDPSQIDLLGAQLNGETELATLAKQITEQEQLFNPNVVKLVMNSSGEALYFSRSPIPHIRLAAEKDWVGQHPFYKHIGMYAYRTDVLEKITKLPVSSLEKAESLEQLRWIQNGYRIKVAETTLETIGIDTPADMQKALTFLAARS